MINQQHALSFYSHSDCHLHHMGDGHPEQPARLSSIKDELASKPYAGQIEFYEANKANIDQLKAVHAADYVDVVFQQAPANGYVQLDPDTLMNAHSLDAALRAAGAAVDAVDQVMVSGNKRAFCAVRPPGHHAEFNRAMGFCIFNNIAVGAAHALNQHGLERVAILDFDVHHGNGTEDIFFDNNQVLFCSSFQHPFYPYTDIDHVNPHIIKTPLPANTGSAKFRQAIEQQWLNVIHDFQPQLIMLSAGFDAHAADHLAELNLSEADYRWVTQWACTLADQYAEGRVVSVLEGGYNLQALQQSVWVHLQAMLGIDAD